MLALLATCTNTVRAEDKDKDNDVVAEARRAFDAADYRTAKALASDEIKNNPGHEEAYVVLGETLEKLGDKDGAIKVWENLKKISRVRERVQKARMGLLRTRGPEVPTHNPGDVWENDPYKVDVGEIPWDRLKQDAEGADIQYKDELPPFPTITSHFQLLTCTESMGEAATQLCESYMNFLLQKYFNAGQEWALRVPILIFKNHEDYVNVGKYPDASAGVTYSDRQTGVPVLIALYMLDENGNFDHDSLEGTLPHEITHMVINEWFGGTRVPRWINEGLARRMEQTRNHYEEAAKVGRDAVAGEYYRFRDLFAQKEYPHRGDRTWRFYEQSATIVLFLLEQFGPDAAVAFFESLKEGGTHDEAAAAALGIAPEGAVDEFERRWVDWVRGIYSRFGDRLDNAEIVQATALDDTTSTESFDEAQSVDKISDWHTVRTDKIDAFKEIGGSHRHWKCEGDKLVCDMKPSTIGSLVGVRSDDEVPLVLTCTVRATDASVDKPTPFGISMLDHRADDTGIQVRAVFDDRRPHEIKCVVSDEIALYVDGNCTGRYPALREIDEDIDWPLAFVAFGPLEISDVRTGMLHEFLPLVAKAQR